MAVIGKIRSWGPVLATVIGLALFAFIAEEMFRSCEATNNEKRQQVGEVLGKKVSVQDFQAMVDEYQEVIKMTQGRESLSDDELNQLKDQIWQEVVNTTILEKEANELGLTVTDAELQNILKAGTNPMLAQTPFINQQTGRFDVTQLTKFLDEYKKMQSQPQQQQVAEQYKKIYDYWKFIEKQLRQQTLMMKYQSLLGHCLLSNPVSAKMAFDDNNIESNITLAAIPYTSIKDNEVKIADSDLKAKYDEMKEMFKQTVESRDIKYVDFQVLPSKTDRAALNKTMSEAKLKLESGMTPSEVVRKAQSQVAYTGIAATKRAFPADVAAKLDSMAVGQTSAVFETSYDNTLNVIKLIAKVEQPDSIEFRMIQVGDETAEAAKRADSVYTALKGNADFEALAKKYGQTGQKTWKTSAMYESAQTLDADTKAYIAALNNAAVGEVVKLSLSQANMVLQVTNRKAMTTKYDVAIIKHTIDFSKETYNQAYNKFSQFVSENKTLEGLEKNAQKFGFKVMERQDMVNSEHYVAGVRSTREAMKWVFDAKPGDVSPLYECGNNDHMMVIALTKIHRVGYRSLDDVKDMVRQEVIRDKKFEVAAAKLNGVKSIAAAKQKGAVISNVDQITFSAPAFVQSTGASEPALSGAVSAVKQGQMCQAPVKGNGGAYIFQVTKRSLQAGAKFDVKQQMAMLQQMAMRAAGRYMQELNQKAEVVDNRYLFF